MVKRTTRRRFMQMGIGGLGVGLVAGLPAVRAQDAPARARFTPEIEPIVALLETTPRAELIEIMAARVRQGLSYREVLAALLLAGVRNVQPRPNVGFKFHAVLVVNSAHLASLSSPDSDRWLPIFWALDYFKSSQARDVQEGDWTLPPVDESRVMTGSRSKAAFQQAMESWDEPAADVAIAGLSRRMGSAEIFELLFRYGARDLRDIGHKAIYAANSYRTLQCIGWQYAEPVLRSLVYAMLAHDRDANPSRADLAADRPWRDHVGQVGAVRDDWMDGASDLGATREMLAALREAPRADVTGQTIELLNRGVSPQSLWDALFLAAGQLVLQQPGIIALHSLTTTNALHFAYQTVLEDETRLLLLLQNCAFVCSFRDRIGTGGVPVTPDWYASANEAGARNEAYRPDAIFAQLRSQPRPSARQAYAYLQQGGDPMALIQEARRLVFQKGTDSHDYKFSSAVLEDYFHVSPAWRDAFLASTAVQLRGADEPDQQLISRIRTALAAAG